MVDIQTKPNFSGSYMHISSNRQTYFHVPNAQDAAAITLLINMGYPKQALELVIGIMTNRRKEEHGIKTVEYKLNKN